MATDTKPRPKDVLGEINKYDFRNEEHYVFKARKGLDRQIVEEISEMKGEPPLDAGISPQEPGHLQLQADAPLGRPDQYQFPGRLLLPQAHRQPEPLLGRRAGGDQEHVRQAGHSRRREEVPLRREGPVRERGRLRLAPRGPGQAGRDLHRHRHGRPRASGPAPRVFQHDHPAHRQQVRRPELGRLVGRVVHLRAQGR